MRAFYFSVCPALRRCILALGIVFIVEGVALCMMNEIKYQGWGHIPRVKVMRVPDRIDEPAKSSDMSLGVWKYIIILGPSPQVQTFFPQLNRDYVSYGDGWFLGPRGQATASRDLRINEGTSYFCSLVGEIKIIWQKIFPQFASDMHLHVFGGSFSAVKPINPKAESIFIVNDVQFWQNASGENYGSLPDNQSLFNNVSLLGCSSPQGPSKNSNCNSGDSTGENAVVVPVLPNIPEPSDRYVVGGAIIASGILTLIAYLVIKWGE
jgi:hypothetical protein